MAPQKRGNEYYRQRLEKDWPDLFAKVEAGEITVNKARQLAGLGGTRTRLNELLHAWKTATTVERREFLKQTGLARHLVAKARAPGPAPTPKPASLPARETFNGRGYVQDWARKRVQEVMKKKGLSYEMLRDELGLARQDQSIAMAVRNGCRIHVLETRSRLESWLAENAEV